MTGVRVPAMRLGDVWIDPPVVLAPMAGVTCRPFRVQCREQGAGLVCTEMVSANALSYGSRKTQGLLVIDPAEHPVSLQILAATHDAAEHAATAAVEAGADLVDINMGCSVPKVLKCSAGVDLMREPERAEAVIRGALRGAQGRAPVTAKMRLGWAPDQDTVHDIALRAQEAGVAAVALHARYGVQYMSGRADWSRIAELKELLRIPVIGNGDIACADDALRMMRETGCDAAMVGRGAMGNPWLFAQTAAAMQGADYCAPPSPCDRLAALLRLGQELVEAHGERMGVRILRAHIAHYTRGLPSSAAFRGSATQIDDWSELQSAVAAYARRLGSPL